MNEKLELKHLAPYLPYGLKCEILNYQSDYVGEKYGVISGYYYLAGEPHYIFKTKSEAGKDASLIKPILRPLSDITKEIEVNGEKFIPMDIHKLYPGEVTGLNPAAWSYRVLIKLFEWHFDVFGLIDKGLAINLNSL